MPSHTPTSLAHSLPERLYARDPVRGMVPLTLLRILAQYLHAKGAPAPA